MCLTALLSGPKPRQEKGVGWKVLMPAQHPFKGFWGYSYHSFSKSYKYDKWYRAKKATILTSDMQYYETGFHIYLRKYEAMHNLAMDGQVVKVEYKNGHTLGEQRGLVIVADYMKLVPPRKRRT